MNNHIKEHLLDIEDYYFNYEKENYKYYVPDDLILRRDAKEKVKLMYKSFPKLVNPRNNFIDLIFYSCLNIVGSFIVILNIWIYKRYFNLIFRKVKLNPRITVKTNKIANYKRDRRFKNGYRDESIRWESKKVIPNPDIPYWNLTKKEIERNKLWAWGIGITYLITNLLVFSFNKDAILGNLFCFIVGGIMSFLDKSMNNSGIHFDNNYVPSKFYYQDEPNNKFKIAFIAIPILVGVTYLGQANQQKIEKERIEQQLVEAKKEKIEKERVQAKKDSSQYYLGLAIKDFERKRYKKSIINFDTALLIYNENYEALFKKGIALKESRKYQEAITELDRLSKKTELYKSEIYLIKGQCLLKLKKKEDAIIQVYNSAQLDNEDAKKLYDKINPFIKVLTGYRRRCCDGTTSYAEGKGACSHHRGVCKWNEPVYKEGRKYNIVNK